MQEKFLLWTFRVPGDIIGTNDGEGGNAVYYCEVGSPVGKLLLTSDGMSLTGLYPGQEPDPDALCREDLEVFAATRRWLEKYFSGKPEPAGNLPLKPEGTPFQKRVWEILLTIQTGQVRTYGDIARQVAEERGKEKMSSQAVGQAVGRNPISIIIPCHRCIGAGNRLTGYAWGLEMKAWLLRHEGWDQGG